MCIDYKELNKITIKNRYCNAPIPQVRGRYGDVHTQGENTLARTLRLSTGNSLHIHKSSSIK